MFLDDWVATSEHNWTIRTLPDRHWKWRMRHAAVTFAEQCLAENKDDRYDIVFCTDMMNVAEFRGLCNEQLRDLPVVLYFHENQLTYPNRDEVMQQRDLHFGMTNIVSALAADAVWFNSHFHRAEFLAAVEKFIQQMPPGLPPQAAEVIAEKSTVHTPGVDLRQAQLNNDNENERRATQPLHLVWAARWEHDKNPDDFFNALRLLKAQGETFRLSVVGQSYADQPPCFELARRQFEAEIGHWGFLESRDDYWRVLRSADVFVSTANHEFFGISAVEAMAAGCIPVLPNRLAYPEIASDESRFLYDGTVDGLVNALHYWTEIKSAQPDELAICSARARRLVEQYDHAAVIPERDVAVRKVCESCR